MNPNTASPELAALRQHWRRWMVVVAQHAARCQGAPVVDAQQYQILHQELLRACAAAGNTAPGTGRQLPERLEELARPWLTARVLEQTDREIILDLLARCRLAEKELYPASRGYAIPRWTLVAAVPLGIATAMVVLLWTGARTLRIENWLGDLYDMLGRITQRNGWWFVAAAAILIAIAVVWRSGRKLT
jgi:hypothetical protein